MRVQVIVPRHLGDAVIALPTVRLLQRFADVLVRADGAAARLLAQLPDINLAPDRGTRWDPLPSLLLAGSLRVALQAALAKAPLRVGRSTDMRGALLTDRVPEPLDPLPDANPAGRRLPRMLPREAQGMAWLRAGTHFVHLLGGTARTQLGDDRIAVAPEWSGIAARWLASADSPTVLLHPWAEGAPTRRWPLDQWAELGARLRVAGERVAVTGGPGRDDARAARTLAGRLGAPVAAGEGSLSPMVWAAAAGGVSAVVLPDTGLSHLATATGARSVVLFGSSDPARHAPSGPGDARVVRGGDGLSCAPCYRARCAGPIPMRCMEHSVDSVVRAVAS